LPGGIYKRAPTKGFGRRATRGLQEIHKPLELALCIGISWGEGRLDRRVFQKSVDRDEERGSKKKKNPPERGVLGIGREFVKGENEKGQQGGDGPDLARY